MPSTSTIRDLTIRATTPGVSEATNALNSLSGAQTRVASSAEAMGTVTDLASKRTLSAAAALERFAKSNDEAYAAEQRHVRGMMLLERAAAQGLTGTREFAIAQAALNKVHHEGAAAAGLNRMQLMELGHIGKSVGDEFIATGSIMRGLTLESGRLVQVLAEGQGGVGGTLKAVGGIVGRLATGWVGLGVATAGAAAVGVASVMSYVSAQDRMAASLEGVGRRAGLTLGQLNAVAAAGAGAAGISLEAGQSLAMDYTQRGFGGDLSQSLIGSSRRFGEITGQDTAKAGAKLGDIFADPARGVLELNKTFGFLDARLQTTIDRLTAQGDLDGARMAALDAYTKAQAEITDRTWSFAKALHGAEGAVGSWLERTGHALATTLGVNGDADKLAQDRTTLANLQKVDPVGNADYIAQLREEITRLERGQADEAAKATADAAAAKNRELSLQLDAGVKAALPDLTRSRGLEDRLGLLARGIGSPGVVGNLGFGGADVHSAFDRTAVQLANIDPFKRMVQDAQLATASIEANSLAERAAVEARRAELTVLREDGDLRRASLAARIAENQVIAKANSDAEDRLSQAKQDAALVGLSPYERGRQEIENRYSGVGGIYDKDFSTRSEFTDAMAPVNADLRRAGETIARTLQDYLPDRLSAAGDRLVSSLDGIAAKVSGTAGTPTLTTPQAPGMAFGQAPAGVQAMIVDASSRTGMDRNIIAAIGQKENSYRLTGGTAMMGADGRPSSAYGFGQLTNGAEADVKAAVPGFSKYDPNTAVFGAAEYLKILSDRNHGNMTAALNAYGGTSDYAADIARRSGSAFAQAGAPLTVHPSTRVPLPPVLASTARASDTQSHDTNLAAFTQEQAEGPLKAANTALAARNALLDTSTRTMGQNTAAVQAAADAQRLLSQYQASDPNHAMGADQWSKITAGVNAYRESLQKTLQAEDDLKRKQQEITGAMDDVRSSAKGFLDPLAQAALHGTSAVAALHQGLESLGSKLTGKIEDSLISSAFGATGTSGGGLFSMLGGLFGGGSTPGVAPGAGGIGHMATGGMVYGPGHGTSDSVPAWLSNGEFVVNAAATRANSNLLHALNTTGMAPRFADGGMVGGSPAGGASAGGGDTYYVTHVHGGSGDDHIRGLVSQGVQHGIAQNNRALPGMLADQKRRAG